MLPGRRFPSEIFSISSERWGPSPNRGAIWFGAARMSTTRFHKGVACPPRRAALSMAHPGGKGDLLFQPAAI